MNALILITATFIFETPGGLNTKQCHYQTYSGERYTITVKNYQFCPPTIKVRQ